MNKAVSKVGAYTVLPITEEAASTESLLPLAIVLTYIGGAVIFAGLTHGDLTVDSLMVNFMGLFFVVFSLFKMINLHGFADAFSTYDILASRSRAYAIATRLLSSFLG